MFELNSIQTIVNHCIYETFARKREMCALLLTRKKVIHRKYLEDIKKIQKIEKRSFLPLIFFFQTLFFIEQRLDIMVCDVLSKSFCNDVFPFVVRNTAASKKKNLLVVYLLTLHSNLLASWLHLFLSSSQFNQNKTNKMIKIRLTLRELIYCRLYCRKYQPVKFPLLTVDKI